MHLGGTLQEQKIRLYHNPEVSIVEIISRRPPFPIFFGRAVFFDTLRFGFFDAPLFRHALLWSFGRATGIYDVLPSSHWLLSF